MMSFRDRAFCSSDCQNLGCSRFISDDVEAKALAWTRTIFPDADEALMSLMDMSDNCTDYQAPEEGE